jgi:hypothetical protein
MRALGVVKGSDPACGQAIHLDEIALDGDAAPDDCAIERR